MRVTRSFVPNLFTLANLFCGFYAIVVTSQGEFKRGALFVLAAAIFDTLDGFMARLTKSTSEFGVELDSLCDAVSFGVAPAYMLYKVYFFHYGDLGILLASLPALAGVMRLARFNVQVVSFEDKKFFKGLPIPSGALTIISYIIFYQERHIFQTNFEPALLIAVTIITSLTMVSTIKFDNLPKPTKTTWKERPVVLLIFFIAVIGSVATLGKFIFPFMVFYIVVSSVRHFYYYLKRQFQ